MIFKLIIFFFSLSLISENNLEQIVVTKKETINTDSLDQKNQILIQKKTKKSAKKILILYSDGGSCHKSATAALTDLMSEQNYEIKAVNFFKDVAAPLDPIKSLTFGYISCEDAYNKMLKNGWNSLVNYYAMSLAPILLNWKENDIKKLSKDYFKDFQADLIISTIPMINYGASQAAKELNIPYILLTLDCELKTWLSGFSKPDFYENMYITLWCNSLQIQERLKEHFVPEDKIIQLGFPVRKQFFEKKDICSLKKAYNIPENKFIIMLMDGGSGESTMYRFAKKIISMHKKVHIIACAGKNERLERKLNRLKTNQEVSITTLGFIQNVSDIMAISDLLITNKRGPGTLNEAILMEIPILISYSNNPLFWEKPHEDLIKDNGLGSIFENTLELENLILSYLSKSKEELKQIFKNKSEIAPPITKTNLINLIEQAFDRNLLTHQ